MIFLVLILIVFVVLTIYSWYSTYNVLKYLIANWKGLFSKEFLIFFAIAIPLFIIIVYLGMRQPAYFEQGIEQLHSSKYIKDKIYKITNNTAYLSNISSFSITFLEEVKIKTLLLNLFIL